MQAMPGSSRIASQAVESAAMLTGRESLMRLIGKRRRHLSLGSLLSSHQALLSSNLPKEVCGGPSDAEATRTGSSSYSLDVEWVTCPVCGSSVRGSDSVVNSHLDACLSRRKKRKLTQSTLRHFNFSSESSTKTCTAGSNEVSKSLHTPSTLRKFPRSDLVESNGKKVAAMEPVNGSHAKGETPAPASVHIPNPGPLNNLEDLDAPSKETLVNASNEDFNIFEQALLTYIVGRKFHNEVKLSEGSRITVMRDPKNVKDPNAIKVLSLNAGPEQVVGFLPRELAQYLSPLMDKYNLILEGSVISLPEHSSNKIPIQLVCQEMVSNDEMTYDDCQVVGSMWKNALQVVQSTKTFPPDMTRYQQNFCFLIQEVLRSNAHLFTDDEKLFLGSFNSLLGDSQRLFVRLYSRKGPWFRMSSILYSEISDIQQATEELCVSGFFSKFDPMKVPSRNGVRDVLEVLSVSELREISNQALLKLQKSSQCTKKKELIEWLAAAYEDGNYPSLPRIVSKLIGTCVEISSTAEILLSRIQRLFFLNGEQDLSTFLLVDMGLVKFPSYMCNICCPIFSHRSDLIAYEEAIEVAQIMDQALDENDLDTVGKCVEISECHVLALNQEPVSSWLSCFSAMWVHSKVLTLGTSFFEQERRYNDAVRLLKHLLSKLRFDRRRGYWTLRLSVDLEHMGEINGSLVVAEEGVQDPWIRAGPKMALQRRVLRLGKPPRRWKTPAFAALVNRKIKEVHVMGRPLNCDMSKSRFYGEDGEQCGVEELALQYYAGEGGGWKGVHTESGIWMTLFGILMWDIVFADVPDVFQNKFQTAPLDLETDSFYASRKDIIESQLEKICSGMAEEILIISWESHLGTMCRGVNWDRNGLDELRAIVTCIGGPRLASLFRHLAQDYRSWSSGMPDLVIWRFVDDYRGEVKLVEVKGPRDRLSEQQRAWLLLLADSGFDTEVCKVSPSPSSP